MKNETLWTRNFSLLCLANLFMAIGFYLVMPTLPLYVVNSLGEEKSHVGYLVGIYTLSALLIRPLAGYAVDNFSRKLIYLTSFLFFALIFGFYAIGTTFFLLLLLRFLHGFTWGIVSTASGTVVVDLVPISRRGEGIGLFGISMTIAMALGPMFGLLIMGEDHYLLLFGSACAIALIGLTLALFIKYPEFKSSDFQRKISIDSIIAIKCLPTALIYVLVGITYGGLVSFITIYAQELNIQSVGPFFLLLALGIGISRVFAGKIVDIRGPREIACIGLSLLIIGYFCLAAFHNVSGFLLSGLIIGVGQGIIWPTLQTMGNNMVNRSHRGVATSTMFTASDMGIGIGSIALGIFSDHTSLPKTYFLCSGILVLTLLITCFYVMDYYNRNKVDGK